MHDDNDKRNNIQFVYNNNDEGSEDNWNKDGNNMDLEANAGDMSEETKETSS